MEILVLRGTGARRALAALTGVAGLAWALAWGFSAQLSGPASVALGLAEGQWRALLTPALAVALLAAVATLPARWPAGPAKAAGSSLILAGLALLLVGNLLEYGPLGAPSPTVGLGSAAFTAGGVVAALGTGMLAAGSLSLRRPRPILRASIAAVAAATVALTAIAVPSAAAMLATGLIDALLREPAPALPAAPIRRTAAAGA